MRILWHGVSPQHKTGYGVQTGLFTRALTQAGHEVIMSPNINNMPPHIYQDMPVVNQGPRMSMGNDWIDLHCQKHRPDIVLSMMDTHIMDVKKYSRLPWVAWQVIDAAPLYPEIKKRCDVAKINLAMSLFGQNVMAEAGVRSEYVPLAYDPTAFCPTSRAEARRWLCDQWAEDWADRPVVLMNAANMCKPARKNFGAAFKAFAQVCREPDYADAIMYCHTEQTGIMCNGENLVEMASMYGVADRIRWPNQYEYNQGTLDAEYMRMIYNASDLLIMPSMGEGFGVPLIEAQACGLLVLTVGFSAMPELTLRGKTIRDFTLWAFHEWQEHAIVDPDALAAGIMEGLSYAETHGRKPPAGVREYEIGNVYSNYLAPILKEIEDNPTLVENKKGKP